MDRLSLFFLIVAGFQFFLPCHLKSISEWNSGEEDNRDYETPHDRILAVNLAHVTKRAALENNTVTGNGTENENTFQQIEKANEALLNRFYQGDIDLQNDTEMVEYVRSGGKSRNAIRARKRLWTDRIIPYRIPYRMRHITANVRVAVADFHKKTCLRFVQYNSRYHKNYIEFNDNYGCSSKVGKKYHAAGRQGISLGDGCNSVPTIIHEMMHAVGFWHEQARSDRDRYVKIYWDNILEGFKDQFDKYSWRSIDKLGVSYDYQSIMHYSRLAFSRNGKPTIVATGNEKMEFKSPDWKLSQRDAIEINALYDCKTKRYGWTSWSGWTPCDENCYRTRERYCYHSGNIQSCGGNVNVYGVEKQSAKCSKSFCPIPVDGGWGRWYDWGRCSKTCNDGVKTRHRRCNNPEPVHGGKPCPGSGNESVICSLRRCNLGYDDVDFENFRLGMWSNSKNDALDWAFKKGFGKIWGTGPNEDHTTGKGYYLYVESILARPGQRALLISPWQSAPLEGKCMKFYYTMYGARMGTLAVKLELLDGRNWYIFYKKGNQGASWKKGILNIDPPPRMSYRLTIEARIGGADLSNIAIDDVYIDLGLCKCQDNYVSCSSWAARGYCRFRPKTGSLPDGMPKEVTNPAWMKQNCKRSCASCRPAVTAPPPTTAPKICKDNVDHCPSWAKKGECKKNPAYMLVHCRKSCKVCRPAVTVPPTTSPAVTAPPPTTAPKICKDNVDHCPSWAKKGECKKNPAYMLVHCRKSCKVCRPAVTVPPTTTEPKICKDNVVDNCPLWEKKGECKKNPAYMLVHCRKSCKVCIPCSDTNAIQCPRWAKRGECKKNPDWMLPNCKLSCHQCKQE